MNTELYTNEGWITVDLNKVIVSDHVCCECGEATADKIVNQGRSPRTRLPILWAVCEGCAEEIGAENHHAEFMAEHE